MCSWPVGGGVQPRPAGPTRCAGASRGRPQEPGATGRMSLLVVTATLDPLGPRRGTRMLGTGFDRGFGCCVTWGIQVETGFHRVKPKRRACLAH